MFARALLMTCRTEGTGGPWSGKTLQVLEHWEETRSCPGGAWQIGVLGDRVELGPWSV